MAQKMKSVFGPIISRRLGVSLGVDLLPFKTCSLDCVYCECGATTNLTMERGDFYPVERVLAELDDFFAKHGKVDYVTFSGVGEPTLHTGIGQIVRALKTKHPEVRICLITNATLLGDPGLQKELEGIDLIMPSLDASCEEEFIRVNRPAPGVTFEGLLDALKSFRANNKVEMWLEVFIVPGVNDSAASLERFVKLLRDISPDQVQINSLDRPGTEDWIGIPTRERLEEIKEVFDACGCPVSIISRKQPAPAVQPRGAN